MKKSKRVLAALVLTGLLLSSTVSAASFWFPFPGYGVGSMCWTETYSRRTYSSAYVKCSQNAHATGFFLTPTYGTIEQATQPLTVVANNTATHYFTWNSGYGTWNTPYYLAGYPNINYGSWNDYNCSGTWGD